MSFFRNPRHPLNIALHWSGKPTPTSECLHCDGSGKAPGDGRTECGFCEGKKQEE